MAGALNSLLKKRDLLTRDDLVIEWRPLYQLYERLFHKNLESLGLIKLPNNIGPSVGNLIKNCRVYFPIDSTEVNHNIVNIHLIICLSGNVKRMETTDVSTRCDHGQSHGLL